MDSRFWAVDLLFLWHRSARTVPPPLQYFLCLCEAFPGSHGNTQCCPVGAFTVSMTSFLVVSGCKREHTGFHWILCPLNDCTLVPHLIPTKSLRWKYSYLHQSETPRIQISCPRELWDQRPAGLGCKSKYIWFLSGGWTSGEQELQITSCA